MGLGIPPLKLKIMLESNTLKSGILVRSLALDREGVDSGRAPLDSDAGRDDIAGLSRTAP